MPAKTLELFICLSFILFFFFLPLLIWAFGSHNDVRQYTQMQIYYSVHVMDKKLHVLTLCSHCSAQCVHCLQT